MFSAKGINKNLDHFGPIPQTSDGLEGKSPKDFVLKKNSNNVVLKSEDGSEMWNSFVIILSQSDCPRAEVE